MYGLTPQNIGKVMNHGYAGSYARQPDMIANTHPAGAAIASARRSSTTPTARWYPWALGVRPRTSWA